MIWGAVKRLYENVSLYLCSNPQNAQQVNYELGVTMVYQHRFMSCNKCPPSGGGADDGGGSHLGVGRGI